MFARVGRTTAVALATAIFAGGGAAAAATVGPGRVAPNQVFSGVVNGQTNDAVVTVVCPGPGTTGRALPGQTLEVIMPEVISINSGNTGAKGRRIVAEVGSVASTRGLVTFTRYDAPKPFPTDVPVPCGGTGTISFVPLPNGAGAKAATVTVTYANVGTVAGPNKPAPRIVARPDSVMVNTDTELFGTGFASDTSLQIVECSQKEWIVPQSPCDTSNAITVKTNAKGRFRHAFLVQTCPGDVSPGTSQTCYIGHPQPVGVDQVELSGAATITVTGP